MLYKVAVIGPESTGKSTLCAQLAQHFNAEWCPEFAREYLVTYGKEYSYEDLLTIAMGQAALEDEFVQTTASHWSLSASGTWVNNVSMATQPYPPLLFIDTDMYVMKVWCEYVYRKCHQYVLDEIVQRKYDLYLLCDIDAPWVRDDLREYPSEGPRQELYQIYKDLLINQSVPWVNISGSYDERLTRAVTAVNGLIKG